jgi:hypothetical protein
MFQNSIKVPKSFEDLLLSSIPNPVDDEPPRNAMTDYDHGRAAALRGAPRCLGCDPAGTEYPDWYAGWDSAKKATK